MPINHKGSRPDEGRVQSLPVNRLVHQATTAKRLSSKIKKQPDARPEQSLPKPGHKKTR